MYRKWSMEGKMERITQDCMLALFSELAGGGALALMTAALASPALLTQKICSLSCKALLTSKEIIVLSMNLNLGQIRKHHLKVKMISFS